MAKKEKQQQPIDAFKAHLNLSGIFPALVTGIQGKPNLYFVFSTTGFEQYEFKNGAASKLLDEKWENWTSVTVDHFLTQSVFILKSDSRIYELKAIKGRDVSSFIKANTNIHVEEIPRKWWNKILGFRSKTKWKMTVAVIVYFMLFGGIVDAFSDQPPTAPASSTTSKETVPEKTPEQLAQEKADANKITDDDKKLLKKSYSFFTSQQRDQFDKIKEKYKNLPNSEVVDISTDFVRLSNEEASIKKAEAEEKAAADAKAAYQSWVQGQFSGWDGSNRYLVDLLKDNLNDPKSFEHVETRYADKGDHLIIRMTYRAKNGFGGLILQNVTAKSDYKTGIISVISQND